MHMNYNNLYKHLSLIIAKQIRRHRKWLETGQKEKKRGNIKIDDYYTKAAQRW